MKALSKCSVIFTTEAAAKSHNFRKGLLVTLILKLNKDMHMYEFVLHPVIKNLSVLFKYLWYIFRNEKQRQKSTKKKIDPQEMKLKEL